MANDDRYMEGMALNWYYARGDERVGPVDDEQLNGLVASGTVREDTLVWREGMSDWAPLGRLSRLAAAPATAEAYPQDSFDTARPGLCSECGRSFPVEELIAYEHTQVCAECKPYFFQRLRETGSLPGQLRYAGFWIRFGARIIDGIILIVVGMPLSFIQNRILASRGLESPEVADEMLPFFLIVAAFWFIGVFIGLAYEMFFVGRYAATPGKMALGLKVVMSDGGRVSYGRVCGRYFAMMLSQITLYIGYIIAGFDEQKRSLHDHICDTRVVFK